MLRRKTGLRGLAIVAAALWPLPLLGQTAAQPQAPATATSGSNDAPAPPVESAPPPSSAASTQLPAGLPTTRRDYMREDNPWDTTVPSSRAGAGPLAESASSVAAEPETEVPTEPDAPAEESESPIRIYGFSDMTIRHLILPKDSPWFTYLPRNTTGHVGNLNVYFDTQMGPKWRALSEIRFTYLPDGAASTAVTDGLIERGTNQAGDYTEFSRATSVGGIIIERAYLQYMRFSWLSIKAGQWLTPYGVWNVDHGSPTVISVRSPFIIGAELFPRRQVGLLAEGTIDLGKDFELGYALGVSNGRTNDFSFYEDFDANKAVTLRSAMTWRGMGELTVGATAYKGRATRASEALYYAGTALKSRQQIEKQWDEVAYAIDLRWTWSHVHLQTEWIMNDRKYTDAGRTEAANGGLSPDRRLWGGYALLGYRTPWLGTMPYFKFEYSPEPQTQAIGIADKFVMYAGGLNIRPVPRVVFKVEYTQAYTPGQGSSLFAGQTIRGIDLQAAWAF